MIAGHFPPTQAGAAIALTLVRAGSNNLNVVCRLVVTCGLKFAKFNLETCAATGP